MGVNRLTTFVKSEQDKLLIDYKLHHSRLVIDGNNLMYIIWENFNVEQQYGGDYDVFAQKCRVFIRIFRTCNVELFVVFDGGFTPDNRKMKTKLNRLQHRIEKVDRLCKTGRGLVVPILAHDVFTDVLDELHIPHVSCDFESDREMAVLANRFMCPVLSFDSDFYIFDLLAGFIPANFVKLATEVEIDSSGYYEYIPVKLYTRNRFARQYKVDPLILPLFACILCNDYVEINKLQEFYFKHNLSVVETDNDKVTNKIKKVLKLLRRNKSNVTDCLQSVLVSIPEEHRESMEKSIKDSMRDYACLSQFDGAYLEQIFDHNKKNRRGSQDNMHQVEVLYSRLGINSPPLPSWFMRARRQCLLSPSLQDAALLGFVFKVCQVEDLSEQTSYICSYRIRQVCYAIILNQQKDLAIKEYVRCRKEVQYTEMKPCRDIGIFPALPSLDSMPYQGKEYTTSLLFKGMELSKEVQSDKLSPFFKFLVGLVVWWIGHSNKLVNKKHCYSIFLATIALHLRLLKQHGNFMMEKIPEDLRDAFTNSTTDRKRMLYRNTEQCFKSPQEFKQHKKNNRIIHAYAMFQSCLKDMLMLNQLLMMPIQPPPRPSLIINSSFAYNMYRRLEYEKNPMDVLAEILVAGSPIHTLFKSLIDLVH